VILTYLASETMSARARLDILMKQPWPADTMAGSTSGGDVSDPTGNTATTLMDSWLEHLDQMDTVRRVIIGKVNELDQLCKKVPHMVNTQRIVEQQQCTGGSGMPGADEWGAAKCDEVAERLSGHNAGLCARHIRYRNRWEQQQREGAA